MIHLKNNYYAEDIVGGYKLIEKGVSDKGKETQTVRGYFGDLGEVLSHLCKLNIHDRVSGKDMELPEALQIIREENSKLISAFRAETGGIND